ncbi:sel1 repeat family protein, partial [Salmonella enterica subsp. enterica serovar Typhimurium var. 5-]|nr:sel1 repeat family protein [Salmonella enterica subsp. enterica serovar Typhimurium var. 5-]
GVMFMQGEGVSQDYQQALAWYRKAARQGLPAAQTHLGIMSAFGRGVAQSDRQAIAWYRKAAKQDFAKAQYQLGVAYSTGRGVPENSRNALKWYLKAAEQGFTPAQSALGEIYAHGRQGVPKDNKQAYIWYYMASMYTEKSKDDCSALIAERNRLKGTLTPDQLSETYAAFNLIWRKIDQSKEAKKIARKKY